MAFHRSFLWGSALLVGALLTAVACGGRDQLSFGDEGFGGDGFGGDDPVGPGQGGFISQGGGGFGSTTTSVGSTTNVTVTTTVTTGAGGAPATSTGSGASGPSSSSVTVSSGITTTATTVATTATTVTSGVTTVTTTATSGAGGAGGMGPSSSVVTVSGSGSVTSGGPLDCFSCIQGNCPQAAACLQNPACLQGTICAVSQCLGGPPDFGCVINCFNGDFMAAFQALQAVTCIFQQCGQQCQGLFGP